MDAVEVREGSRGGDKIMMFLRLSNSPLLATIDDEDWHRCKDLKWRLLTKGYVGYTLPGEQKSITLHNFIMNTAPGANVDHIDRDPRNNCRSNLRLSSNSEQGQNRGLFRNNKTGYKGVSFKQRTKKYVAQIRRDYKVIWLGEFRNSVDAARCYDEAAIRIYGPTAFVNFPQSQKGED